MRKTLSLPPPKVRGKKLNNTPTFSKNKDSQKERSIFYFVGRFFNGLLSTRRRPSSTGSSYAGGASFSTDGSSGSSRISSTKLKSFGSGGSSNGSSGPLIESTLSFAEIYHATDHFSPNKKIGDGGFSSVYKAKLKNGATVAVKRASKDAFDKKLSAEFKNEIHALSKIEHLNLVRLYGYVDTGDEQIIVVEYIANGTLRDHLDGTRGRKLDFTERLGIAIDVAHAITYLHTYTEPPIIHRDIKSTNILITEKLRAKVADFGFAKLTSGELGASHYSTQIKGTTGYLDPEYLRTLQLTDKSDVYSFGVLLAELVTGRTPLDFNRPSKEKITVKWALQKLHQGVSSLVLDPSLKQCPASQAAARKVLELAGRCVVPSRQMRPSMKECAEILWAIRRDFTPQAHSHYRNID